MPPVRFVLLLVLLLACLCSSCRSTNQLLKAKPVPFSAFIEHPELMRDYRDRVPFHRIWSTADPAVRERAAKKTELYIAPVTLRYLRPLKKPMVRKEVELGSIDRREQEMAVKLRQAFAEAFDDANRARYYVCDSPNARSMTLELALVELNPTSPKGNAVKTAAKFVVGPLAGLGGILTKGNVAIEGKVRNSKTGELVCQFADNEADRMTFYTLRDFRPYGHAEHAMKEWGQQFALFTRTPDGAPIQDTFCFTLDPR